MADVDVTSDGGAQHAPIRIFMSYRRADDRHFVGRLHDRLCDSFGDDRVFRDIDSIPVGADFRTVILRTLDEVDAVVAVIGPQWGRTEGSTSEPDFVVLELAEALRQEKPVIPVLIEATSMPTVEMLPPELAGLARINAITVHGDPAFRRDSARLVAAISAVVEAARQRAAMRREEDEERRRRADREAAERQLVAERLRAEERAARQRLIELEEAAARRQIEIEKARLEEIAVQLRRAEAIGDDTPTPAGPALAEAPVSGPPSSPARVTTRADPTQPGRRSFPASTIREAVIAGLLVVAGAVTVIALTVPRSDHTPFDQLSAGPVVDLVSWILALSIGAPLVLVRRPAARFSVLVGVTAGSFFHDFLQSSARIRYGAEKIDEGPWITMRLLGTACLLLACLAARPRPPEPADRRVGRVAPVRWVVAIVAVVHLVATIAEWRAVPDLIGEGRVPGRSGMATWIVALWVGPTAAVIAFAGRATVGAYRALATIATMGCVGSLGTAALLATEFDADGMPSVADAGAHAVVAAIAWRSARAPMAQVDPG